uniref:hypothetical protein n=1 Tax=Ezakiella massiliensis TaxID=1852374 RepID=UPI00094E3FB2|nr:hypothetical protein [Ezakiella massiliensis]
MKKYLFKCLMLICFCIFTLSSCKNQDFKEIVDKEIVDYEMDIDEVYDSERGFGNDRFTIYSFSVSGNKDMAGLKPINDLEKNKPMSLKDIKPKLEYIKQNHKDKIKDISEIEDFIRDLEADEDGKFMYFVEGGTYKLYIYNPKTKNGYLFVFVI